MKTSILTLCLAIPLKLQAFEVHEWGTFTTVAGSDGELLIGLQREEESLPSYVHHQPGFQPPSASPDLPFQLAKKLPVPAHNVKVKMETPVIYFHAESALTAKVKVTFNGGSISQWYPQRHAGEVLTTVNPSILPKPPIQKWINFAEPYQGFIEWNVDVLSPEESRRTGLFHPEDLLQWTYARVPEANALRSAEGETEGFLFYRGLGSFETGLTTRFSDDDTLLLENHTGHPIPYTLVYERLTDGSSRWFEAGGLEAGKHATIPPHAFRQGNASFDRKLFSSLSENLAHQGLLASEAEAMVKTWWKSYFETPGLRVFWVLPEERTDAILPLEIEPAPDRIVRVIVGRSEVIRPAQEREWLAMATSSDPELNQRWIRLTANDRFGLAYAERVNALMAQANK